MTESLVDELAELILLSDEALWQVTTPTFTKEQQERLALLNDFSDDRALTAKEKADQTELLFAYDQSVLRRAQAFAILLRRGHRLPTYSALAARA